MAQRDKPVLPKGRDPRVTPQSIEAGKKNLAKGRAATKAAREQAKGKDLPTASERWAMLLDGTLTVRDLDDKEIKNMRVRNQDGTFGGKARRLPSHLAQQFTQEAMRRANDQIRTAVPEAVKVLVEIANDPDAKHADRLKAVGMLMDRGMGRAPETIRIETGSPWEDLLSDSVGVDRNVDDATSGQGN